MVIKPFQFSVLASLQEAKERRCNLCVEEPGYLALILSLSVILSATSVAERPLHPHIPCQFPEIAEYLEAGVLTSVITGRNLSNKVAGVGERAWFIPVALIHQLSCEMCFIRLNVLFPFRPFRFVVCERGLNYFCGYRNAIFR